MRRKIRLFPVLLWGIFLLWLLVQLLGVVRLMQQGKSPIDFLAYRVAAEALERGSSPYRTPNKSLQIWRSFHQDETNLLAASARGKAQVVLRELDSRPQQPGPYVYPPTLALLITQLNINAFSFAGLALLAILGFGWLWLRSMGGNVLWLLLIMFSLDVLASLHGGNVELLLLFATLLSAWLLWHQRALFAAPLITFVVLIKPFYIMFFIAFGLLQLISYPGTAKITLKTLATAVGVMLALIVIEVYRWGPQLQLETLHYLLHALDYQWFVLPVPEQTPMSAWNRTPLQALINAGMSTTMAQWTAFVLWLLFLGLTVWCARGRHLTFPLSFALAFVLLYWGRPVGWGLIYLELVVLTTVWSTLQRWQKPVLLALVVALMVSHWWALVLTARGYGMPLLTLQSAELPWETWLVLPFSWLILLYAMLQTSTGAAMPTAPSRKVENVA